MRSRKSRVLLTLSDFVMCWFALCGMANAAVGVVSFAAQEIKLQLFQQPVETLAQRLTVVAMYTVISGLGFTYILWRYRWSYRLSTLFKIAISWFAMLALYAANVYLATAILAPSTLAYTIYWSLRDKSLPDEDC